MDKVTAAKLAELAASINLPDCVLDVPTVEQETLLGRRKPNDAVGIARFLAAYRARVRLIEAAELLKAMAIAHRQKVNRYGQSNGG